MNKEQILKMQVGRELDDLVAEKVMGYEIERFSFTYDGYSEESTIWLRAESKYNPVPFSTDISAAWKVVETYPDGVEILKCPDGYLCFIITDEEFKATGDTAQEAICKASLLEKLNI